MEANTAMVPANGNGTAQRFELALVAGDLSKLSTDERLTYYNRTCESLGLNPLTKPFEYINLNGKLVLYARRDCTDQLRKLQSVSVRITGREQVGDVYTVTARATTPTQREDESIGAVNVAGLRGESLANAFMKAETKAKRRVTLSICGLGFLDETEVETIQSQVTRPTEAPIPEVTVEDGPHKVQALIDAFNAKIKATKNETALSGVVAELAGQPEAVKKGTRATYAAQKKAIKESMGKATQDLINGEREPGSDG